MGFAKSDIKLGVMEEIAKKLDSLNKHADKTVSAYEAGAKALDQAAPKIAALASFVEKDLDDGKLEEMAKEPLLIAQYAKDWIGRAIGTVKLMADQARDNAKTSRGKVSAFETALDYMESLYVAENAKKARVEQMLRSGELVAEDEGMPGDVAAVIPIDGERPGPRPPGVRPAPSIAQQRRQEEAAEKAKAEEASQEESETETPPEEPTQEPEEVTTPEEPQEAPEEPETEPEESEPESEEAVEPVAEEPPAPPEPESEAEPELEPEPEPEKAVEKAVEKPKKKPKKHTRRTAAKAKAKKKAQGR